MVFDRIDQPKDKSSVRRLLYGVHARNLKACIVFVDLSKAFDSAHIESNNQEFCIPSETIEDVISQH